MADQNERSVPETEAAPAYQAQTEAAGEMAFEEDANDAPAKPKKKKNWLRRHWVLLLVLAILLAVGIVFATTMLRGQAASAEAYQFVRTTTLQKTSLENSVTTTGTVAAGSTASVTVADSAKLYKVTEVLVQVGDRVNEGDVIVQLDTTEVQKDLEKAQQDYNDTLQSAQTSYDRALADYESYIVQHDNNLIDLQEKIDQADETLADAQSAQSDAQSAYDAAASTYDKINAAYVTATENITAYTQELTNAENNLNNALATLNNAINTYNSYLELCRQEFEADNTADPADYANLCAAADAMINAYYAYNGNTVSTTSVSGGMTTGSESLSSAGNTVDTAQIQTIVNRVSVSASYVAVTGSTSYANSAAGVYTTAYARYSDVTASISAPELGYSSYSEIEQALSQAATAKSSAEASLEQAKSSVETAEQQVTSAHDSYDNEKNYSSLSQKKQTLDDAETKLTQAKRTSDTITTLQQTLADCTLTATMTGTVTALSATVGSVCSTTVATIQDTDGLTVEITISANKVPEVSTGMTCYITSDTTDETITGTLTQIDPVANEQGTFGAEVTVTGDSSSLLIGTQAEVEIMESQTENVFVVPLDAVGTDDDGTSFVYRKTGGEGVDMTFEKVTVTTGTANDYYTEISGSDLAEGDVIRSNSDLSEGIESSDNTQDMMSMMMGGGGSVSMEAAPGGGGERPQGGGGGGAPGGM